MNSLTENKFDINVVDLENEKKEFVRVGVVQLELDEHFYKKEDGLYYPNNDDLIKEKYLKFLKCAKEHNVNILCFPELSSSETLTNELVEYSNENNIIIIGGTFYNNEKKNICPIIIPNSEEIYYNEKITLSPLEKSYYNHFGAEKGEKNYIIKNSPFGSFAVLICSEYLDNELKNELFKENIDFLFVVSLNREWRGFHTDMNRDCINNRRGIYIIYSNSILKINDTEYGNGRSAIFGILDDLFLDQPESDFLKYRIKEIHDENMIIADFSTIQKKAIRPRNPDTEPNIYLIHPEPVKKERDVSRFLNIIGLKEQRYERIEELYVPPIKFSEIYNKLINNKIIFLVGDPEIGKTYTSFKLLLDSYKDGYEPVYYSENNSDTQFKVLSQELETVIEDKKAIYFEDPWGKEVFKSADYSLRDIGGLLDKIEEVDTRVIITSRRKVFKQLVDRREIVEDLNEYAFDLEINGAYHKDDLKKMLEKYLIIFKPKWHSNIKLVSLVKNAINEERLKTPMSIKKLIDKSMNINDENLDKIIYIAEEQTNITFGREILSIFESEEYEKIVFLSFPYISSFFDLNFIRENYNEFLIFLSQEYGFNRIKAEDFDSLLELFSKEKDIEVYSKGDAELLKYSHASYSGGFSCALNNRQLYKNIFYNLILKLADHSNVNVRRSVATIVFEKFDRFPEIPNKLLIKLAEDEDTYVKLIVGEVVFEKFNKFPRESEKIIEILSEDEGEIKSLVCDIISENFENMSKLKEEILYKFSIDEESYIRISVCDLISENFEGFSEIPCRLLLKLAEDEDTEVKKSVADLVFEKFDKFKEVPGKLFLKLYENPNSRVLIVDKSTEIFVKDSNLIEKLLIKLSEYEHTKIIVGKIFAGILNRSPKRAEDLLFKLSEIDDRDVKMLVCDIISENFNNISQLKEDLLFKLADDYDSSIRYYANDIFNNFNESYEVPEEFLVTIYGQEDRWNPEM